MIDYGFTVSTIAQGQDTDIVDGNKYLIDTRVVRLSQGAMDAWFKTLIHNCRETYETREEWEAYKAAKAAQRTDWETKVAALLGLTRTEHTSICISQSLSEVFTVVCIAKVAA